MLRILQLGMLPALVLAAACGRQNGVALKGPELTTANVVTSDDADSKKSIGDGKNQFEVGGTIALQHSGDNIPVNTPKGQETIAPSLSSIDPKSEIPLPPEVPKETTPSDSLLLGFPKHLIGEGQIFGAVVTKVSNHTNETLGRLKLMEIQPRHVRPKVVKDPDGKISLVLYGCEQECNELSLQSRVQSIPIDSVSIDGQTFYLDLGYLGRTLSLLKLIDPEGEYTSELKQKYSKATFADYSSSTLVFDIESHFIPKDADPQSETAPETVITVRWYMKLESGMNSAFEARNPEEGVGFFTTERSAIPKIERHALTQYFSDQAPVFYFLKNVPQELKAPFQNSLEHWNDALKEVMGRDILGYKIATEEEAKQLVTGDVRYNILEWDLENIAPYGGLGPAVASQNTGEIFSSNVLVQGPTIVKIYKEWFRITEQAKELRASGRELEADELFKSFKRQVEAEEIKRQTAPTLEVRVGTTLMTNPASDPRLQDRTMARMDFYETPEGETYESYMRGYWEELVTHEIGHNMGLRHNFRGNLGADDEGQTQSWSVMEYLSRPYRHRNKIGSYDKMALAYGYAGKKPSRTDMYCTDEDVASTSEHTMSAECSRDDATNDPFSLHLANIRRVFDLAIARSTPYAPNWSAEDLSGDLKKAVVGAGLYASSALKTGAKWTNWQRSGRPTELEKIPPYVAEKIRVKLCDPSIDVVIRGKENEAARAKALSNLSELRKQSYELLSLLEIKSNFRCDSATP